MDLNDIIMLAEQMIAARLAKAAHMDNAEGLAAKAEAQGIKTLIEVLKTQQKTALVSQGGFS